MEPTREKQLEAIKKVVDLHSSLKLNFNSLCTFLRLFEACITGMAPLQAYMLAKWQKTPELKEGQSLDIWVPAPGEPSVNGIHPNLVEVILQLVRMADKVEIRPVSNRHQYLNSLVRYTVHINGCMNVYILQDEVKLEKAVASLGVQATQVVFDGKRLYAEPTVVRDIGNRTLRLSANAKKEQSMHELVKTARFAAELYDMGFNNIPVVTELKEAVVDSVNRFIKERRQRVDADAEAGVATLCELLTFLQKFNSLPCVSGYVPNVQMYARGNSVNFEIDNINVTLPPNMNLVNIVKLYTPINYKHYTHWRVPVDKRVKTGEFHVLRPGNPSQSAVLTTRQVVEHILNISNTSVDTTMPGFQGVPIQVNALLNAVERCYQAKVSGQPMPAFVMEPLANSHTLIPADQVVLVKRVSTAPISQHIADLLVANGWRPTKDTWTGIMKATDAFFSGPLVTQAMLHHKQHSTSTQKRRTSSLNMSASAEKILASNQKRHKLSVIRWWHDKTLDMWVHTNSSVVTACDVWRLLAKLIVHQQHNPLPIVFEKFTSRFVAYKCTLCGIELSVYRRQLDYPNITDILSSEYPIVTSRLAVSHEGQLIAPHIARKALDDEIVIFDHDAIHSVNSWIYHMLYAQQMKEGYAFKIQWDGVASAIAKTFQSESIHLKTNLADWRKYLLHKLVHVSYINKQVTAAPTVHMTRHHGNTKIIFVGGLGCRVDDDIYISEQIDDYMCNTSKASILSSIAKQAVCRIPPSKADPFVNMVVDKVKTYITQDYNVLLCGMSYGGAVCSRVAEIIAKSKFSTVANTRLNVATFGSIYIPRAEPKIAKIVHYMNRNDVAVKCNKIERDDNRVVWLQSMGDPFSSNRPKRTLTGTKVEWEIHVDYVQAIQAVVGTLSADSELALSGGTSDFELMHIVKWTKKSNKYQVMGTYRNINDSVWSVVSMLGSTIQQSLPADENVIIVNTTKDYTFLWMSKPDGVKELPDGSDAMMRQIVAAREECHPGVLGINQTSDTCWFNAALNSLLLSQTGRTLLTCKVSEFLGSLDEDQRAMFLSKPPGMSSCPIDADRAYMYFVVYHTLAFGIPPKAVNVTRLIKELGIKPRPLYLVEYWVSNKALRQVYKALDIDAAYVSYKRVLGKKTWMPKGERDSQLIVVEPSVGSLSFELNEPLPKELNVNGKVYILDAGCLFVQFSTPVPHYAAASFTDTCGQRRPVVYDSNNLLVLDFDWTSPTQPDNMYERIYKTVNMHVRSIRIAYAVYSKADVLSTLKQQCTLPK